MLDRLFGLAIALGAIGSGVYALAAVALGLPPGDLVCALEARFGFDGSYDMIEAWAVTWFHLLLALATPFASLGVVGALRDPGPRPLLSDAVAARARALSRRRLASSLGLALGALGFYATLALAPWWLEPFSFLARLGLVLGPIGLGVALALFLDAVLAPSADAIEVHRLDDVPARDGRKTINGVHEVDAAEAARLRVGARVSIVATRVVSTVLSVTPLDPYR